VARARRTVPTAEARNGATGAKRLARGGARHLRTLDDAYCPLVQLDEIIRTDCTVRVFAPCAEPDVLPDIEPVEPEPLLLPLPPVAEPVDPEPEVAPVEPVDPVDPVAPDPEPPLIELPGELLSVPRTSI